MRASSQLEKLDLLEQSRIEEKQHLAQVESRFQAATA